MPLDAAAVAALRAEFASEHGGITLIPDVQAALVSELAGSGEDLAPAQGKGQSECTNGKPGAVSFSLTHSRNMFKLAFNSAMYLI